MFFLPEAQRELAQISIRLFTFGPFEFERFGLPFGVNAEGLDFREAAIMRRRHFASPTNFPSGSMQTGRAGRNIQFYLLFSIEQGDIWQRNHRNQ